MCLRIPDLIIKILHLGLTKRSSWQLSSFLLRTGSQEVSSSLPSISLHQLGSIIHLQPITSSELEAKVIVDYVGGNPTPGLPSNTWPSKGSISSSANDSRNKVEPAKERTKAMSSVDTRQWETWKALYGPRGIPPWLLTSRLEVSGRQALRRTEISTCLSILQSHDNVVLTMKEQSIKKWRSIPSCMVDLLLVWQNWQVPTTQATVSWNQHKWKAN